MRQHKQHKPPWYKIQYLWDKIHSIRKEQWILIGFFVLFGCIFIRLIELELISQAYYENKLISQHFQHINIKAKRGNILVESPSGQPIQLTANSDVYDIFIDPKYAIDKPKIISELTPILIDHYCPQWSDGRFEDPLSCLKSLEIFTNKSLLPTKPVLFYLGSGITNTTGFDQVPTTATGRDNLIHRSTSLIHEYQSGLLQYEEKLNNIVSGSNYSMIKTLIQDQLDTMIIRGNKPRNYLTYLDDPLLKQTLVDAQLPFVIIEWDNAYVVPFESLDEVNQAGSTLYKILSKYQIILSYKEIKKILTPQESRYVKIATNLDRALIAKLKTRKTYRQDKKQQELAEKRKEWIRYTEDDTIPLLHGLWFEQKTIREYPFWRFASHILGFVDKNGRPLYGIEEYRDEYLKGRDGQIIWFGTPRIGDAGEDDLQLSNPTNGANITLTIEPNIQKKVEEFTKQYLTEFNADSVSIIIMNPYDGSITALANAPDFDPNDTNAIYQLKPLDPTYSRIIDDPQYLDIPVYIRTWWVMKAIGFDGRADIRTPKYMNSNYYGPLSFIDKNTALAYEPGSIFKAITAGIGLDIDEIELYDTYYDKGELQVWDYFIKNVSSACLGTNTILHALQFSCNIGMVHIIQKIGKHVFYNYLDKFGFGKITGIEIAGEVPWSIPDSQLQQKSRFFNNSFGQWLLVTPMQIAVAYSTLVNGWYVVKPNIVKKITLADGNIRQLQKRPNKAPILKEGTSELIKTALYEVVNGWQIKRFAIKWKSLAWKTGTSQIPFRGKYQNGVGRTNGSFAGIITKDNTKYVIVIQVRRPRSSQWWETTAWLIYGELAKFLIAYEDIES